jgi:hypothetical protein
MDTGLPKWDDIVTESGFPDALMQVQVKRRPVRVKVVAMSGGKWQTPAFDMDEKKERRGSQGISCPILAILSRTKMIRRSK